MTSEYEAILQEPWAGFSRLDIGPYKIGIAITDEGGEQDPEEAGQALADLVQRANRRTISPEELERAAAHMYAADCNEVLSEADETTRFIYAGRASDILRAIGIEVGD